MSVDSVPKVLVELARFADADPDGRVVETVHVERRQHETVVLELVPDDGLDERFVVFADPVAVGEFVEAEVRFRPPGLLECLTEAVVPLLQDTVRLARLLRLRFSFFHLFERKAHGSSNSGC
jgi:hypothetical protein